MARASEAALVSRTTVSAPRAVIRLVRIDLPADVRRDLAASNLPGAPRAAPAGRRPGGA